MKLHHYERRMVIVLIDMFYLGTMNSLPILESKLHKVNKHLHHDRHVITTTVEATGE
jgi:hypothetical protein